MLLEHMLLFLWMSKEVGSQKFLSLSLYLA
jgi:hypothetical protein